MEHRAIDDSNVTLVRHLCENWHLLTLEDFQRLMKADCLYLNMPMANVRCVGPDQSYALLSALKSRWNITQHIVHICGKDDVVLTERLERFENKLDDSMTVDLHVMGVFELKEKKLIHWRDYFDSQESRALAS